MQILPAIDIKEGMTVWENRNPVTIAKGFADAGATHLHIVDLNGTLEGRPINLPVIKKIIETVPCKIEVSSGICSEELIEEYLELKPWQIVLSSVLVFSPDRLKSLVKQYGADNLTLSLDFDSLAPMPLEDGTSTEDQIKALLKGIRQSGIKRYIVSSGNGNDPDFTTAAEAKRLLKEQVITTGGIRSLVDVQRLQQTGIDGAIVGNALYSGEVAMADLVPFMS